MLSADMPVREQHLPGSETTPQFHIQVKLLILKKDPLGLHVFHHRWPLHLDQLCHQHQERGGVGYGHRRSDTGSHKNEYSEFVVINSNAFPGHSMSNRLLLRDQPVRKRAPDHLRDKHGRAQLLPTKIKKSFKHLKKFFLPL